MFIDHAYVRVLTEKCPHGLRQRRTYEEVASTPAAAIIKASGVPEPWPDLVGQQQEIVDERERQAAGEAATASRFAAEALRGKTRVAL